MPQIELVADEILSQRIQKRRVRGRVRGAKVIDRIHDASAHQVVPDTVNLRAGEKGVLRRGDPVGEELEVVGFFRVRCRGAFFR